MSMNNYHSPSANDSRRFPSPPMLPHMAPSSSRVQRSPPRTPNSNNIFGWQPPPGASHSATGPHGDTPIPFVRNTGRIHPYSRPRAATYSAAGPSYVNSSMFTVGPASNYRSPSPVYGLPSSLGPGRGTHFLGNSSRPAHAHRLSASRTPLPALHGGPLHGNNSFDLGFSAYPSGDPYADSPFGRPHPFPDVVSPSFMSIPSLPIIPMHVDPPQADHGHGLFGHGSLHHEGGLLYTPPASNTAHLPYLGLAHENVHTPEPQGVLPLLHAVVTHPHPPSSGLAHIAMHSGPPSPSTAISGFNITRVGSNSAPVSVGEELNAMHTPPSLSGSDSSPPGSVYSVPPSPNQTQGATGRNAELPALRQGFELEPAQHTGDPLGDFWGALTAEANEAARGKPGTVPVRQRPRGVTRS
ncbi:hypothetical protein PENSPDRAFT_664539 [Peniophora sp. CONT]|nr:hypothetical protein PENSPDRAFT_664539 [Peniophora sp. CONT]